MSDDKNIKKTMPKTNVEKRDSGNRPPVPTRDQQKANPPKKK